MHKPSSLDVILQIVDSLPSGLLEFTIQACKINESFRNVQALCRFITSNKTVKRLYLAENGFDDDSIGYISASIQRNTALELLDVGANNFTDRGAMQLSAAMRANTTLSRLHMKKNDKVTPKTAVHLFLAHKGRIRFVLTHGFQPDEYGLPDPGPDEKVGLHNQQSGSVAGFELAKMLQEIKKDVLNINFGNNNLDDDGAVAVGQALKSDKKLVSLDLHRKCH